ncbi:MAG: ABC transporter substrate-binding protein, partial [Candidatus Thorarchaeota archaeon]
MKKTRWISLSLAGILVASVFLPYFAVMPTVATIQEPIKIGVFAPFTTSGLAHYAPWTQQGFELGLIYATTEMGYNNENMTEAGRPYEIHYYDTKGDPTSVGALVTDAIEIDNIDILVGGTHSNLAAVIAPIAEEYEKLYFITPAADSQLTASLFNPYVFRLARNSICDASIGIVPA